jgi:hypothetical protein
VLVARHLSGAKARGGALTHVNALPEGAAG